MELFAHPGDTIKIFIRLLPLFAALSVLEINALAVLAVYSVLFWLSERLIITEAGITIKKGIIFRSTSIISFENLIAVSFTQNLFDRIFFSKSVIFAYTTGKLQIKLSRRAAKRVEAYLFNEEYAESEPVSPASILKTAISSALSGYSLIFLITFFRQLSVVSRFIFEDSQIIGQAVIKTVGLLPALPLLFCIISFLFFLDENMHFTAQRGKQTLLIRKGFIKKQSLFIKQGSRVTRIYHTPFLLRLTHDENLGVPLTLGKPIVILRPAKRKEKVSKNNLSAAKRALIFNINIALLFLAVFLVFFRNYEHLRLPFLIVSCIFLLRGIILFFTARENSVLLGNKITLCSAKGFSSVRCSIEKQKVALIRKSEHIFDRRHNTHSLKIFTNTGAPSTLSVKYIKNNGAK